MARNARIRREKIGMAMARDAIGRTGLPPDDGDEFGRTETECELYKEEHLVFVWLAFHNDPEVTDWLRLDWEEILTRARTRCRCHEQRRGGRVFLREDWEDDLPATCLFCLERTLGHGR